MLCMVFAHPLISFFRTITTTPVTDFVAGQWPKIGGWQVSILVAGSRRRFEKVPGVEAERESFRCAAAARPGRGVFAKEQHDES